MLELSQYRKVLLFGASGIGKTTLMGTANFDDRTKPYLHLDFDGSSAALDGSGIKVLYPRSLKDYSAIYAELMEPDPSRLGEWYASKDDYEKKKLINSDNKPVPGCFYDGIQYKSIGLDTVSEAHIVSLLSGVDKRVAELIAADKKDNPNRIDINIMEQSDYGHSLIQMRRFLRYTRDLPMHVFASSQIETRVEKGEGSVRRPALAGILGEEIISMFDVSAALASIPKAISEDKEKEGERVLLLHSQQGIRCKVRTPWGVRIPPVLRDPSIEKLFDLLNVGANEAQTR